MVVEGRGGERVGEVCVRNGGGDRWYL